MFCLQYDDGTWDYRPFRNNYSFLVDINSSCIWIYPLYQPKERKQEKKPQGILDHTEEKRLQCLCPTEQRELTRVTSLEDDPPYSHSGTLHWFSTRELVG